MTGGWAGRHDELVRKAVHLLAVGPALTLRHLPPLGVIGLTASLTAVNLWLLPLWRGLWREGELRRRWSSGIVLYPATLLAAALALPGRPEVVAGIWALLGVGDGAATLVGRAVGGPRLPWSGSKTVAGSVAFVVGGGAAATALVAWTAPGEHELAVVLRACLVAALAAAAAESWPWRVSDNVTLSLAGGATLWAALAATDAGPAVAGRWAWGVPLNLALAWAARRLGALDRGGAIAAAAIGSAIAIGAGVTGWTMLALFFALGVGSTSWRRGRAGRGTPSPAARPLEESGGRGARNVVANGVVAAGAALAWGFGAPATACSAALAAALAEAAADTVGGEVGQAVGGPTVRLPDGRRVVPGTEGGISLAGSAAGLAAASAVAALGAACGPLSAGSAVAVALCGVLGAGLDSVLGGTLERRGALDNEGVNLAGTLAAALLAAWWIGR